eukprot:RCo020237
MACPRVAAACRMCCIHLMSLKVLLTVSFIALMVVAGFLGVYLTYIQSQQSLRESADVDIKETIQSVKNLLIAKIGIGHQLNLAESMYFANSGLRLDDFANAYAMWRPLTMANLMSTPGVFTISQVMWPGAPGRGRCMAFVSTPPVAVFCNLNASVCNDT